MHFQPGRLWNGLPVLCHRSIGSDEKHVGRRDSGTGSCGRESHARRRSRWWSRAPEQHRVHGHGRTYGQLQVRIERCTPNQRGISARNITVSTVGVVPGIKKLTAEGIPVRLAVSLHAPSDELRDELVPMNKRFNTTQVLDAAHDYYLASKRRVSIEYALMRGINDQAEHAKLLAKRLNHYGDNWAHVNPIPLNPIEGSKWTASKPEDEQQFLDILHKAGITATLRDTRGQDIDGACGQLAAKEQD